MIKIPTKSMNCDKNTLYSFRIFFSLERNNFRIAAFCDEIFIYLTFVATVTEIFANRIVYSFPSNTFQT